MKWQKKVFPVFIILFLCAFLTWTERARAAEALDNWHLRAANTYAYGLGYGNGVFVAPGYVGVIMTSADGAAWVVRNAETTGTYENLTAVACGGGKFVAVGGNGTILTSADNGATWTLRDSGTFASLWGIAYGNGKFVAVGDGDNGGAIVSSADGGLTWTARNFADRSLQRITYGNGVFIAGGMNFGTGIILTSADGITWTQKSSLIESFWGLTFGSGKFVAVGDRSDSVVGTILTSANNGVTWQSSTTGLAGTFYLNDIAYGHGTFTVVGDIYANNSVTGIALTSPDGGTWTSRTAVAQYGSLYAVAYGNGTFVALSAAGDLIQSDPLPSLQSVTINGGAVYTANRSVILTLAADDPDSVTEMQFSHDEVVWSAPEPFSAVKSWTLAAGDGQKHVYVRFKDPLENWSDALSAAIILDTIPPVASAQPPGGIYPKAQQVTLSTNESSATIFYTLDGSPPTADSPVYQDPIPLSDNRTLRYFARDPAGNCGEIQTENYLISLHPLDNWQLRKENTPASGLGFGNGVFVAVGYTGSVMTSSGGTTWTSRDPGTSASLSGVAYGNGTFAAVGENGTILTSADNGVSWTNRPSGAVGSLRGITYSNGVFAAVGDNGTILTSTDNGATWVVKNSGAIGSLWDIASGNGVFVAVGDGGIIMTSADNGAAWISKVSETIEDLRGVVSGGGIFVTVGMFGTILTSADNGATWTSQASGLSADLDFYGIAYGNGMFVAVGENYASGTGQIMTSADGTTWLSRTSPILQDQLLAVAFGKGTFVALSFTGAIIQSHLLKGDINTDQRVDLADIILGLKVMNGERPPEVRPDYPASETDPDGNGKIGLPDIIYLLQKISGLR